MRELKFKTWFPAEEFSLAHMTEAWTIEDIALNYDGGVCMYFSTEATPDVHNDLIGIVSYSDKNKNYENRNYVKRQYTGMKDKNGTEIYEGDIIRLGGKDAFYVEYIKGAYFLSWSNNDLVRQGMLLMRQGMLFEFCPREMEVIGNIYESPDLLVAGESLKGQS
jgi:uncharacterized phage protein (TIGR01671 family)